jgi:CheY-like chemotaxis protein
MKKTVLVVEDESLIRMGIADYLEEVGFTVLEAANADQAIRLLEANANISVVFTDIDMPGTMDGLRLAQAVRDRWPPVGIIVTSGHVKLDATALPKGGLFVAKPYDPDLIRRSIDVLAEA